MKGKWGYSSNEERYSGDFTNKEDAIEEGKQEGASVVGQYTDVIVSVRADRVIDRAVEDVYDQVGDLCEDWLANVSTEDRDLLTARLSNTFWDWLKETKHTPRFFSVDPDTVEAIDE
jgi:hypothetical protein